MRMLIALILSVFVVLCEQQFASAMTFSESYRILGVNDRATQDEVKAAWRSRARELMVLVNGGDMTAQDELKRVNAAYDMLKAYANPRNNSYSRDFDQPASADSPFLKDFFTWGDVTSESPYASQFDEHVKCE
ncbi:MAG: DnaJ domain-containing protein [Bdellovibrionales bacterium]|nr:DnaJ domain-containing protein [Bdellovibrionales bacterium]